MKRIAIDLKCKACRGTGYLGAVNGPYGVEICNSCVMTGISHRIWTMVRPKNKRTRAEIRAAK